MRKRLRLIIYPLLGLLGLLAVCGFFLLRSQIAARFVAGRLFEKAASVVDGEFLIGSSEGDLVKGITFFDIEIQTLGRTWLKIRELSVRCELFYLLTGLLHFDAVDVTGLELVVLNDGSRSLKLPFVRSGENDMAPSVSHGGLGVIKHFSIIDAAIYQVNALDGPANPFLDKVNLKGKSGFPLFSDPFKWFAWCSIRKGSMEIVPLALPVKVQVKKMILSPELFEVTDLKARTSGSEFTLNFDCDLSNRELRRVSWDAPCLAMDEWGMSQEFTVSTSGIIRGNRHLDAGSEGDIRKSIFQIDQRFAWDGTEVSISGNLYDPLSDSMEFQGTIDFSGLDVRELLDLYGKQRPSGKGVLQQFPDVLPWLDRLMVDNALDGSLKLELESNLDLYHAVKGTLEVRDADILGVALERGLFSFGYRDSGFNLKSAVSITGAGNPVFSVTVKKLGKGEGGEFNWSVNSSFEDLDLNLFGQSDNLPKGLYGRAGFIFESGNMSGDITFERFQYRKFKFAAIPSPDLKDGPGTAPETRPAPAVGIVLHVQGPVPENDHLNLAVTANDLLLGGFLEDISGSFDVNGSVTGSFRKPEFFGTIHTNNVVGDGFGVKQARIDIVPGGLKGESVRSWDFLADNVRFGRISWPRIKARVVENLFTGNISNSAGDVPNLYIDAVTAQASGSVWNLDAPAGVGLGKGIFSCNDLRFSSEKGEFTVSLEWEQERGLMSDMSLTDFIVAPADFDGIPFQVPGGELSAHITVTGPLADPEADFSFDFHTVPAGVFSGFSLFGNYSKGRARLNGVVNAESGGDLQFDVAVPVSLSFSPFAFKAETGLMTGNLTLKDIDLAKAPLPDQIGRPGRLTADLALTPSPGALPWITGELIIRNVDFVIPETDTRFADGRGSVFYDGKKITLKDFQLYGDQGDIFASGSLEVDSKGKIGNIDMDLSSELLALSHKGIHEGEISFTINVGGSPESTVLKGEIVVLKGKTRQPPVTADFDVSEDVVVFESRKDREGDRAAGHFPDVHTNLKGIDLDLVIKMPGNAFLHAGELDVELKGELRAVNNELDGFNLTGSVYAVDGRYQTAGRDFIVTEGRVKFAETSKINPALSAKAVCTVPGAEITAVISGTVNEPELILESKPWLPEKDIMAYILFGKPLENLTGDETTRFQGGAASLVGSNLLDRFKEFTGDQGLLNSLGFYGGTGEDGDGSVAVSKYFSDDFLLSYEYMFDPEAPGQLRMQYKLKGGFSIESMVLDPEKTGLDIFWKTDF
ncbi:MAG: translocation/assembly module TamB domain-containing protein [Thermodesulfobacteriota bacterium]|nr:translocation/assembly module TamB domain-containing protein [Thermodesulfobacteriota bacterium]